MVQVMLCKGVATGGALVVKSKNEIIGGIKPSKVKVKSQTPRLEEPG
jgi:hypothetical protein